MKWYSLSDFVHQEKYGLDLSNPIVQDFLSQPSNYELFTTAIRFPTKENWDNLDSSFKQFYIEIRFINYISKVIRRYARDFHTKSQRNGEHYLLILDQPVDKEESSTTHKDQIKDYSENYTDEGVNLLEQIEDDHLQEALKQLTDKQLSVLNSYYVDYITQKEIAHHLEVSQQSISKTLTTSLDKLKKLYQEKRERKMSIHE